jgi:hypothetical protein
LPFVNLNLTSRIIPVGSPSWLSCAGWLLWNDSYLGVDDFHTATYVPALGTSIDLIQTVIALHAVWSICVPIALVKPFVGDRRSTPWLGRTGLFVVATIFALGAVFVFWGNYTEYRFIAPWPHQIWIGIAIVGLVSPLSPSDHADCRQWTAERRHRGSSAPLRWWQPAATGWHRVSTSPHGANGPG